MKKIGLIIVGILISLNIFSQEKIKLEKFNGVYKIPCKVNGIPMKFILDTGASDVTISLTEASFLLKQGLLNADDIKGTTQYKIANGELKEGTKIILRKIEIGKLVLENVSATVLNTEHSPLLLGMSALNKLGMISIKDDYLIIGENQVTEISSKEIVLKNIIHKNLSYGDSTFVVTTEFKDFYLGIHILISNKIDTEYDYISEMLDKRIGDTLNKGNITGLIKKIIINDGMWIRSLQQYNYTHIIFMFDDFYKNKTTRTMYSVSTEKLIDIIEDFDTSKFESIIHKMKTKYID